MRRLFAFASVCLLMAGCVSTQPLPTLANLNMAATAQFQTANAPPPGFDRGVQFPQIDANLKALPHWHYSASFSFEGFYSGTQQPARGTVSAEVYANELSGERRVVLKASGGAFNAATERTVEGVRISNDYYYVDQNRVCIRATDPDSRRVAEWLASSLIGGVNRASHTYARKTINNLPAWEYAFLPNDVAPPPPVTLSAGGRQSVASGALWVAPSVNAVVDYTLTLNVDSAILTIIQDNRQVTGQVRVTYRLVETGVAYNISIPNGC